MTEVTIPADVSTSISETTSPHMIALIVPRNWLRTLTAINAMILSPCKLLGLKPNKWVLVGY